MSNVGGHHLIHVANEIVHLTLHAVYGRLLLLHRGLLLLHRGLLPKDQMLEIIHTLGWLTPDATATCGGACADI